jgi:class 3 adenylate cyclase/CHAT domain-containing protein/tetratricopeptide (TPR) repeat protein
MKGNKFSDKQNSKGKMADILLERERLEQVLKEHFRRKTTILFSDISGYTQYIDQKGDICGRALLVRHNRIVLPVIDQHEGRLIEVVGDGVMASFDKPLNAVKAAVAIQLSLTDENISKYNGDEIHVKIGINIGEVLVDEEARFQGFSGDVANVAARILGRAEKDQILITEALHKEICGCEDILCRFHDRFSVKGKVDPLTVYRVLWKESDYTTVTSPKVRMVSLPEEKKQSETSNVFHLELNLEGKELKVSAYESVLGDESTLRHYEKVSIEMSEVKSRNLELVKLLNNSNRRGWIPRTALSHLREIGQILYDEIFTITVKERLRNTKAEMLMLNIDDQLVHIPWELLYDGHQFLCLRFEMGRVVKTRQIFPSSHSRALAFPLKMLILADPTGDLKGAYKEGTQIRDYMDQNRSFIHVSLRSDQVRADSIKGKLRNFDLIHFAGHADYHPQNADISGWRLSESSLTTADIVKMAATSTMPAMIFANACQSGRTEQWSLRESFENDIFGLANAFLLTGVKHYIGTFWEILDEQSSLFALEFYRNLFSDISIGKALHNARHAFIELYGLESIVWASYVLYGDPSFDYMEHLRRVTPPKKPKIETGSGHNEHTRAREDIIEFSSSQDAGIRSRWWVAAGCIVLLLLGALWGYFKYNRQGVELKEQQAIAHYQNGDFDSAIQMCNAIQLQYPQRPLCSVLLGNINLSLGKKDQAEKYFQKVVKDENAQKNDRINAIMGLGRLYSIDDQPQKALKIYKQASLIDPKNFQAVVAQAIINERLGNQQEALRLYQQAIETKPGEPSVSAAADALRDKIEWQSDLEKRKRIDQLVQELSTRKTSIVEKAPSDDWTSTPLTVWLLNFKIKGNSLREGEDVLVENMFAKQLIEGGRVRIVERALMDRLMEELKLGSSELTDPNTLINLGRLMAVKILLPGQIIHYGTNSWISLRIIETETGLVRAAVTESFKNNTSPSNIAKALAEKLAGQFKNYYPLRGRILTIEKDDITLNIGSLQGVEVGQKFSAVEFDARIEIISVEKYSSKAKALKSKSLLTREMKIILSSDENLPEK